MQIDGANSIFFHASHHEKLWGVYQITNNTAIGTKGVTIDDTAFEGDVGVNVLRRDGEIEIVLLK